MSGNDQLARLAQIAADDLARIHAGIAQARLVLANVADQVESTRAVLADTDGATETARQSLVALRDTVRPKP